MVENAIGRVFVKGSRRVIVPGVGAFIKRENGEIIFTDMLREDDGMLAASVVGIFGISEDKAREIVGHYALGLKKELQASGRVAVNGIGILTADPDGKYIIESGEAACSGPDTEIIVTPSEAETTASANRPEVRERRPDDTAAAAPMCKEDILSEENFHAEGWADAPAEISVTEDCGTGVGAVPDTEPCPVPSHTVAGGTEKTESRREDNSSRTEPAAAGNGRTDKSRLRSALYGEETEGEDGENFREGEVRSVSDDRDRQNSGYVSNSEGADAAHASAASTVSPGEYASQIHIRRPSKPKKRVDAVMVTAIIALLITLGVLLYGYLTKRDIDRAGSETIRIELGTDGDSADISEAPAE